MMKRVRSYSRQTSTSKCQQCQMDHNVRQLNTLTGRLRLLEQMHRSSKEQQVRKRRSESHNSQRSKLHDLNRKLQSFSKELKRNELQHAQLNRLANDVLSSPRQYKKETVSNYTQKTYSPRVKRMASSTTFNKYINQSDLKSYQTESSEYKNLSVDLLVERFSVLMMQGTNHQTVRQMNRREELIRLAGKIREKKNSDERTPRNEYGL